MVNRRGRAVAREEGVRAWPRPARRMAQAAATVFGAVACLAAPPSAAAAVASAAWRVVASGNLATPFWAAESPDGLVTLGRVAVSTARLGYRGSGSVQVPTSVVLAATGQVLYRAPAGWAILNVAASTDGVILTTGPYDEVGQSVLLSPVWNLVAIPWFGQARVVLRGASQGARSGVTDLAATGEFWGAMILYTPPGGSHPSATFLAEGRFLHLGSMRLHYTAGGYLPTTLALNAQGGVVVGSLASFGSGAGEVPFPADAGVYAVWLQSGVLVPGPGGVYAVTAHAVVEVLAHGASRTVKRVAAPWSIAYVAGSGSGLIAVLDGPHGRVATWSVGGVPDPSGLTAAGGLQGLNLTGNGLAAVTIGFDRQGLVLRARSWSMPS
jgi:hypothetical protein